jgi:hypothetical protein
MERMCTGIGVNSTPMEWTINLSVRCYSESTKEKHWMRIEPSEKVLENSVSF